MSLAVLFGCKSQRSSGEGQQETGFDWARTSKQARLHKPVRRAWLKTCQWLVDGLAGTQALKVPGNDPSLER